MLPTQSSQLPAALIVFGNEARSQQKRLRDLGNGAGWQAQPAGDDVQPCVPLGQNHEVLLLHRPQAESVDALKLAGTFKMVLRNFELAFTSANTAAGLEQSQSQPGNAS